MTRSTRWLLLLLSLSAVAAYGAARPDRARMRGAYETSRLDRLRTARVAPGASGASLLARQTAEHYNVVMLSDATEWDFVQHRWLRPDDAGVAAELARARSHRMSVILLLPAVVPIPKYLPAARSGAWEPHRPFRPLSAAADAQPSAIESTLTYLSAGELRARLELWARHDRGEIIGVMFMPDDGFFLDIPAAVQREWFAIAREIAPSIPVLAVAGEFALTPHANQDAWAPDTFDHLIWLNYPYNLSGVWAQRLDHKRSADPDGDLTRYEHAYAAAMQERWFRDLSPQQLIVPVIQTFFYDTEPQGAIPRSADIELQCTLLREIMQHTFGQPDNFSLGYFYSGGSDATDPFPHPRGIYDVPAWAEIVARNNAALEQTARARD